MVQDIAMPRPLSVLVLHNIGDMSRARQTMVDVVTACERYAPRHHYLYQDLHAAVTGAIRRIRFDLILLDSTFLDARVIRPLGAYRSLRDRYEFVRDSPAVKIALAQDEFDNGLTLDDWLAEWRIDLLYACVGRAHWDLIFPRTATVAEIRHSLTGYFDPDRAAAARARARPLAERPIDVGYRVARLPPEFGRYGLAKARLADVFEEALSRTDLSHDISTDPARMLMGDRWPEFLGRCKFALGSEGGSGVWDPRGDIRARIGRYLESRAQASRDEVEAACFPGLDGQHVFRVMSPRVFEAASTMTSQILLRGEFEGLVSAWEHYIPVEEDFSNVDEVIDALRDLPAAERRARACFDALMASPRAHYRTFVEELLGYAEAKAAERGLPGMARDDLYALRAEHERGTLATHVSRAAASVLRKLAPLGRILPDGVKTRLKDRIRHRL